MTTKILRLPEVMSMTALSRSSIYAFMEKGVFPKSISLGARAVGWHEAEILNWITQKTKMRRG
ncbi:MAG: AlpA family transcriptional regulator [Alphaproteobacteria bacterium]